MNRLLKITIALGVVSGLALYAQSVNSIACSAAQDKILREYKGVRLGMKREDVKTALGNPVNVSDTSDDFNLTDDDTMTVHYIDGAVKAIQLSFHNLERAPLWDDVVGDAEVSELPNGARTARKTVATEKFWVTIYQTKDKSNTRITISR